MYRGKDGHIAQGRVELNDTYFDMQQYSGQAWKDFVMCQEVGHTFGLGHQDEDFYNDNLGSCMDYTDDPDGTKFRGPEDNLHPNDHDYDQLTEIYAHVNGTETAGPPGGNGNGKGKNK